MDSFPDVDLWHCRDCLFQLPNKDIFSALQNFARSCVPWALIISHQPLLHRNLDVAIGGFRLLDLERAPFGLPPPIARLSDSQKKKGKQFPRYVGLWSQLGHCGGTTVERTNVLMMKRIALLFPCLLTRGIEAATLEISLATKSHGFAVEVLV